MDYADTNFIVAAHFENPSRTAAVERFLRRATRPVVLGELTELECRNVFARLEQRAGGEAWQALADRLDRGYWRREPARWPALMGRGLALLDRYAHRLSVGTLDVLHLAAALEAGCTGFLSFDSQSNARVLAASLRLRVWPELTPAEKGRVLR